VESGIPPLAGRKLSYTDFSFDTIVASTERRAIALASKTGGRVEAGQLMVKTEEPKAPRLEVWDDYGSPAERIGSDNSRWAFQGPWRSEVKKRWDGRGDDRTRYASEKGAEAVNAFA